MGTRSMHGWRIQRAQSETSYGGVSGLSENRSGWAKTRGLAESCNQLESGGRKT